MKKTHDYGHYYRGYWSDRGRCRIRIYREEGEPPLVVCSQLPDSANTSVTNMAECWPPRSCWTTRVLP